MFLPVFSFIDIPSSTAVISGITTYAPFGNELTTICLAMVGIIGGALLIKKFAFNVPLSAIKVLTGGGRRRGGRRRR